MAAEAPSGREYAALAAASKAAGATSSGGRRAGGCCSPERRATFGSSSSLEDSSAPSRSSDGGSRSCDGHDLLVATPERPAPQRPAAVHLLSPGSQDDRADACDDATETGGARGGARAALFLNGSTGSRRISSSSCDSSNGGLPRVTGVLAPEVLEQQWRQWRRSNQAAEEPLLAPSDSRFTMFPIECVAPPMTCALWVFCHVRGLVTRVPPTPPTCLAATNT